MCQVEREGDPDGGSSGHRENDVGAEEATAVLLIMMRMRMRKGGRLEVREGRSGGSVQLVEPVGTIKSQGGGGLCLNVFQPEWRSPLYFSPLPSGEL